MAAALPEQAASQRAAAVAWRAWPPGGQKSRESLSLILSHSVSLAHSLPQTKAFGSAETDQLYAEEAAAKIAEAAARLTAIPGMVPPNQVADDMADA